MAGETTIKAPKHHPDNTIPCYCMAGHLIQRYIVPSAKAELLRNRVVHQRLGNRLNERPGLSVMAPYTG